MIFIAGPHSAGKTTLAKSLAKYGFLHVETGEIVRTLHSELAPEMDFGTWACKNGHDFDQYIAVEVSRSMVTVERSQGSFQDVLVTGNRQLNGIRYLQENIPVLNGNPSIFLEASPQSLYLRYLTRVERCGHTGISFTQFSELIEYDEIMGLGEIRTSADLIINTEGSFNSCLELTTKFLAEKGYRIVPDLLVEGQFIKRGIEFN